MNERLLDRWPVSCRTRPRRPGPKPGAVLLAIAAAALAARATVAGPSSASASARELQAVMGLEPNLARGADIFVYCSSCHGKPVQALPEGWVPTIAGQNPRYLAKQLVDYRLSRRADPRMQSVATGHGLRSSQDIADVVAYLAAQPPEWGRESVRDPADDTEAAYYRRRCAGCHGSLGAGDNSRAIPRIAGQDFAYLLRQMHDVVDGRRPNMRTQHAYALAELDVIQLVGLARHIAHLDSRGGESGSPEVGAGAGHPTPRLMLAAQRSAL